MRVDATTYEDAAERILDWTCRKESRCVYCATVSQVMEGHDTPRIQAIMNEADLVTPDGMPLVWGLRVLGFKSATRVYGPDLTPIILEMASINSIPVGIYGASSVALERFVRAMTERFTKLNVVYAYSPPYRSLTPAEDKRVIEDIGRSGARILFVGIGNPRQEIWMAEHRAKIQAVMLGIGAAIDFLGGSKPQAPRWMMGLGLEWLYRLATEPRRLWKRYLTQNPRFMVLFALQLLGIKLRQAAIIKTAG